MFKIFISIILLFTAGASFFVWTKPELSDISALRESIKSYEDASKKFESIQKSRDRILKDYNSIEEGDKERLMKILPTSLDEGAVMLIIDDLLKKNNLSLKSISFSEKNKSNSQLSIETKNNAYETENFTVEFSGSYENFKNLLMNLEESLLLFNIKEISFSSGEKNSKIKEDVHSFKIIVETYWRK